MWIMENWPTESPKWNDNSFGLLLEEAPKLAEIRSEEIMENSEKFPVNFPIETVRCEYLKDNINKDILERNINSVYPILHEKALNLCAQFLLYKRLKGSVKEKAFYANLSLLNFIERLLTKKAVVFVGVMDFHLLIDGSEAAGNWDLIGTPNETEALNLSKCLSYDEIKLGALLSISSYTCFVNDGARKNCGIWETQRENIEDEGIIIGLIGTRLVKRNAMEFEEVLVTREQNTKANGFGQKDSFKSLIANFYEEEALTYDQVTKASKNVKGRYEYARDIYFDNALYAKRMSLSFDTLLLEANERAKAVNKMAFVHVVGLGLGVWRAFSHQREIFLEIFLRRVLFLAKTLTNISDIFFDYFDENSCPLGLINNDKILVEDHSQAGITIHFGKRNPHQKLTGADAGKLLVVSYAADANSLPGNEFWHGGLYHSSDSAAAASTQITELHNPFINKNVTVGNLRVATLEGVLTLQKYIEKVMLQQRII